MSKILKLTNAMTARRRMDATSGWESTRYTKGDMWVCSVLKMPNAVVVALMRVLKREGGRNFERTWM
jgi:hypothetical protein